MNSSFYELTDRINELKEKLRQERNARIMASLKAMIENINIKAPSGISAATSTSTTTYTRIPKLREFLEHKITGSSKLSLVVEEKIIKHEFANDPLIKILVKENKLTSARLLQLSDDDLKRIIVAQPFILAGKMNIDDAIALNPTQYANLQEKVIRTLVLTQGLDINRAKDMDLSDEGRRALASGRYCEIDEEPSSPRPGSR